MLSSVPDLVITIALQVLLFLARGSRKCQGELGLRGVLGSSSVSLETQFL